MIYDKAMVEGRAIALRRGMPPGKQYDPGEYWGSLLHNPKIASLAMEMGIAIVEAGRRGKDHGKGYTDAERELIDQVLFAAWSVDIIQGAHFRDALAAGVRLEAIEALRAHRDDLLTPDELEIARYARQVVSGTVDDATYAPIARRFGTRGAVEFTAAILWIQWSVRMMQAMNISGTTKAQVDQMIEKAKAAPRP